MLHDMATEAIVVAVILTIVLLSAVVIATAIRERVERRRAHQASERRRRRIWDEYAAACAASQIRIPSDRPFPTAPQTGKRARSVREGQAGLCARPAKS